MKKMIEAMLKETEHEREETGLADLDETSFDDSENDFP
jgi:hypothetical protein